ncbi:MAG: hypothetical protein R3C10_11865 [Pirellulales bacterium]
MINTTATTENATQLTHRTKRPNRRYARSMNIRGVPDHVWHRARTNAIDSRMALKEYVIRLLSESDPYPSQ